MITMRFHAPTHAVAGSGIIADETVDLSSFSGRPGLLMTDYGIDEQTVTELRSQLDARGLSTILYSDFADDSMSTVVEKGARVGRSARAQFVAAAGGFTVMSAARAACRLIGTPGKPDVDDLIDGRIDDCRPVPLIDIPFTSFYPFQFSCSCFLVDARNRRPVVHVGGSNSDLSLYELQYLERLSSKNRTYDVLSASLTAVESLVSGGAPELLLPLAGDVLRRVSRAYGGRSDSDERMAADAAVDLGIAAALAASQSAPGPATVLSFAVQAVTGLSYRFAAAALLPHFVEWLSSEASDSAAVVAGAVDALADEMSACDLFREIAAGADIPLRLRELDVRPKDAQAAVDAAVSAGLLQHAGPGAAPEEAKLILERAM